MGGGGFPCGCITECVCCPWNGVVSIVLCADSCRERNGETCCWYNDPVPIAGHGEGGSVGTRWSRGVLGDVNL
jgi:hypothetical protein